MEKKSVIDEVRKLEERANKIKKEARQVNDSRKVVLEKIKEKLIEREVYPEKNVKINEEAEVIEIRIFYHFDGKEGGFYRHPIAKEIPEGAIEISEEEYNRLVYGQGDGFEIKPDDKGYPTLVDCSEPDDEAKERMARKWRDGELRKADHKIAMYEDLEEIETVKKWRKYRIALRNWPEKKSFPNRRPTSPEK